MSQYFLSKRAAQDIRQIGKYTQARWSDAQANRYLQGLHKMLEKLAKTPDALGRKREDLKTGYYSSLYESHVIFFKKQKDAISVIRVLHQRRDIPQQLK